MLRRREHRDRLLRAVSEGKDIIVFDTETTGLDPEKYDIIQFSAVRYGLENGKFVEKSFLDIYINPRYRIPPEITAINHITDEMLSGAPDPYTAYTEIRQFMDPACAFAGYNVGFDVKFTKAMFRNCADEFGGDDAIDILDMARDCFVKDKSGEKGPVNHKLQTICSWIGIEERDEFHSSINDVRYTGQVMQYFLDRYREEEAEEQDSHLIVPRVSRNKIRFWVNPRRQSMRRIYVNTDAGDFFYDLVGGKWGMKKEDFRDEGKIDFDAFRKSFLTTLGISDEHELNQAKIRDLGL